MRRLPSFRSRFRAFQAMRGDQPDRGFIADLEYLENRDLDLSVRIGAMLAFNVLLLSVGTYPVSVSPGAPLSLDAATHPWTTIASLVGVMPIVVSCAMLLRALLRGEEYDGDGLEDGNDLRHRLFAAFVSSIDAQIRLLRGAVRWSVAGGVATAAVWGWILAMKIG